jgi:hypothetical protein
MPCVVRLERCCERGLAVSEERFDTAAPRTIGRFDYGSVSPRSSLRASNMWIIVPSKQAAEFAAAQVETFATCWRLHVDCAGMEIIRTCPSKAERELVLAGKNFFTTDVINERKSICLRVIIKREVSSPSQPRNVDAGEQRSVCRCAAPAPTAFCASLGSFDFKRFIGVEAQLLSENRSSSEILSNQLRNKCSLVLDEEAEHAQRRLVWRLHCG